MGHCGRKWSKWDYLDRLKGVESINGIFNFVENVGKRVVDLVRIRSRFIRPTNVKIVSITLINTDRLNISPPATSN